MRSIFTPVILLALVALAFGETDRQVCQRKNRWIVGAIDTFCSRTNMVVPSDYTNRGLLWKGNVQVSINGGCRPPQWVPSAICKRQFMNMCNSIQLASGKGQKSRTYGNNGCQQWQIIANNKPGQPAKAPKKGLGGNAAKNKAGKILAGLMKGGLKGIPKRDIDDEDDVEEFEGVEA